MFAARNAVDGNRNSDMAYGSCTKTAKGKGSWWQVDLGAVYEIRKVVITNRGDCCGKLNQTRSMRVNAKVNIKERNSYSVVVTIRSHLTVNLKYSFSLIAGQLKGFVIEVLLDRYTHQCTSVTGRLKTAETRRISCMRGAIGNIVKIRLTSTRQMLTLCEVEVFGIRGKAKRRVLC